MDLKQSLRKFYHFVFKGESFLSYLVFIVLSFVFLKYVFYPLFLAVFNLEDVVAVLSPSMAHSGDIQTTYYHWLAQRNISYDSFPFRHGLNVGDAVFVVPAENLSVGDVIVFYPENYSNTVIHRVVAIVDGTYSTKGDANAQQLYFEESITEDRIVGRAAMRIPLLGWPRTLVYYLFRV